MLPFGLGLPRYNYRDAFVTSTFLSLQDDSGCDSHDEGLHVPEAESVSRIQLLEKELAEALEANKKYEDQLSR